MSVRLGSAILIAVLLTLSAVALANRPSTLGTTGRIIPASHELGAQGAQPTAGWVFEGCWAQFQAGPCYDIYRDASGNFWKCAQCGQTKKANPGSCNPISQQTLNSGFWCS